MNLWNVAFISEGKEWVLLHPEGEPLNDRQYRCLIKWSCARDNSDLAEIAKRQRVVYPYQIATLRFRVPSLKAWKHASRTVMFSCPMLRAGMSQSAT